MKNRINLNYFKKNEWFDINLKLFTVNETHSFSLFAIEESNGLASNKVFDVSADFISNTWSDVHNVAKSLCAPRMINLDKLF